MPTSIVTTKNPFSLAWAAIMRRAPRQLSVTRQGKIVIAIAFAAGFAAINTGNNLLLIGWGLILSAIVLSGVLSELTLRKLRLVAHLPPESQARQRGAMRVEVYNTSKYLPAFGVEVTASLKQPNGEERQVKGPYILKIPPGGGVQVDLFFAAEQRGYHDLSQTEAMTAYPFGFFEKSRRFIPKIAVGQWASPAPARVQPEATPLTGKFGEQASSAKGSGDEFYALRDYRPGDDPRHIHWPKSLKNEAWVVTERHRQDAKIINLQLMMRPTANGHVEAEKALAALGSLIESLAETGISVGAQGPGLAVPAGQGPSHLAMMRRCLAEADLSQAFEAAPLNQQASPIALQPHLSVAAADGVAWEQWHIEEAT